MRYITGLDCEVLKMDELLSALADMLRVAIIAFSVYAGFAAGKFLLG